MIQWRRHIHQHAELSYQEVHPAAYIAEALAKMPGIEMQTGIAKTGIKAVLRGGKPGPVVALRADMDALPVEERSDVPFKSTARGDYLGKPTPVAHACSRLKNWGPGQRLAGHLPWSRPAHSTTPRSMS
ncbi:hypothetical protein [Bradyrhizobium sp. Ec3.3]|uniref:hypothetical protein n=1 Tax=Bradyrhizobium sp. Ec3.3 TaxID=189753 RepID=UPI00047F1212|nr:hypothetical protein [Bradyrhizobium sp. Ec3.3]